MREILFRGKTVKEEWVYGLLSHVGNAWYISNKAGTPLAYEVIPSTVGQYTGLTGKNGNKIFEGDIVEYNGTKHEVVFETKGSSAYFGIKISHIETWQLCLEVPSKLMKIIGNIYDNPELLEVE